MRSEEVGWEMAWESRVWERVREEEAAMVRTRERCLLKCRNQISRVGRRREKLLIASGSSSSSSSCFCVRWRGRERGRERATGGVI